VWTLLAVWLVVAVAFAGGWMFCARRGVRSIPQRAVPDLLSNRQLLELAEEAAGFGVWESDPDNNWTWLSAGAAALSGYPAEPTRRSGEELHLLIHPDDRAESSRAAVEAIAHGSSFQCEFRVRLPDGS